jgi:hypothetical protein
MALAALNDRRQTIQEGFAKDFYVYVVGNILLSAVRDKQLDLAATTQRLRELNRNWGNVLKSADLEAAINTLTDTDLDLIYELAKLDPQTTSYDPWFVSLIVAAKIIYLLRTKNPESAKKWLDSYLSCMEGQYPCSV